MYGFVSPKTDHAICRHRQDARNMIGEMKILLSILGFMMGGYMLADGLYVIVNGRYIGGERPGPWAYLFERLGVDVFRLGPLFICFGLVWFAFLFGIWTDTTWARALGIVISIVSLWYLPIGTIISLGVLVILYTPQR